MAHQRYATCMHTQIKTAIPKMSRLIYDNAFGQWMRYNKSYNRIDYDLNTPAYTLCFQVLYTFKKKHIKTAINSVKFLNFVAPFFISNTNVDKYVYNIIYLFTGNIDINVTCITVVIFYAQKHLLFVKEDVLYHKIGV